MFSGAMTALVTPMRQQKVDEKAFQALVEWQISEGIHGLVPCGTTGEASTLSHEEHARVIELCVEAAKRRVPVVAGAGSNSTEEAIMIAGYAKAAGADGLLIATPYYNKPSQEGMYQHYKAIHDAVELPIILYNVPGRSVVDLADETVARLAQLPRIVGLKDATGNLARVSSLRVALKGKEFQQISGEDGTALSFNAQGGDGVISVTSNIAPKLVAEVQNLWKAGKTKEALALHDRLMAVHMIMFCETSPAPVKYALSLLGKSTDELRLPLLPISAANQTRVREAMQAAGIL